MPESLYVIDGHSQIYRAYYAPFRQLTAPSGEPTRATYVFCQMLLNLLRDRQPDYLVMVLDADEGKLLRKQIYPEYKAQRQPTPEDLPPQEERIIQILQAARVPILRVTGHEADDIIATLVKRHAGRDMNVVLVSRDKDLEQLLGPHVVMYDPMKDEEITAERLQELRGWSVEKAVEAQILTGDTVDNVPGVPGIGPKSAAKLLEKYGSVAGVIAHADELTPKQRENVKAFAAMVDVVRQLIVLRNDVPIELDLGRAQTDAFTWQHVRPIFHALGFRRLHEQLPGGGGGAGADAEGSTGRRPAEAGSTGVNAAAATAARETGTQPADLRPLTRAGSAVGGGAARALTFDETGALAARLREPVRGDYSLVNTPAALEALAAALGAQPEFALDTETTAVHPIDAELVGISVAWEVGRAYYIPIRCVYGNVLSESLVRAKVGPIFANAGQRKIGQNLKYDLLVLEAAGLPVRGPLLDTMIAAFVVDPAAGSFGLDKLAHRYFGHAMIPIAQLIGSGRQQLRMDQVPLEHVTEYAAEDADYTWRLARLLEPQLAPTGVLELFRDVEMPLVRVLTEMESHGINLDAALLEQLSREFTEQAQRLAQRVQTLAGGAFNLDSPKQLSEVLFDRLGYRVVRRTKTTRSTDADTLEALYRETGEEIFRLLLEYREIQKLRGTYVDALPRERRRRTGRVHTSFHQTGAVTGRLSSSEPNLQNIPIRTEAGRQIRRAFVPRSPEEVLIVADYSQVELRMLAHFCEDETLTRAFRENQDIHAFVAAQVNGVAPEAVTKEMRSRAKAVNFGIIYGQTAFGLAQATGMSRTEAQAFIDAYFRRYPRIRAFIDATLAAARREESVRTILGRRRPIENINSRNAGIRAQAERFAVNTVIQGSAADLIKLAMIRLHARIHDERLPLRILLQVHDELVCEGPRAEAERLAGVLGDVMTGAMALRVPLKVDVAVGENWLEAK